MKNCLEEDDETEPLAIALALINEPEVFCLDAPTAHLDKNALILLNKSSLA